MDNERWDPTGALVCPYDPLHIISVQRYQRHIIKCRVNHPELDFVNCPFNATHIFHRRDLRHHISICADRKTLDEDIRQSQCPETGETLRLKGDTRMPTSRYVIPDPEEDWDDEIEENKDKTFEQKRITLKKSIPQLRRPKVNTDILVGGYDSDTNSEFSISSHTSSLYVEPVKLSSLKHTNNIVIKPKSVGRGAIATQLSQINRPVGRGAALAMLKSSITQSSYNKPLSIGRGSIKQAMSN